MSNERILIVDDEAGIRQLVKIFLERHHYMVLEVSTGQEGLDIFAREKIDLVVLDLMLPDMYGIDICKKMREHSDIPIIMLTAVQGETNVVLGFEAGADDYVEKPFSPHVLLSRIQTVLKRRRVSEKKEPEARSQEDSTPGKVTYQKAVLGQWIYLPEEKCVKHLSGKMVFLTKNECLLLEFFIKHEQEILSRDRISMILRLDVDDPESRAIDVQISRLRNKLRDKSNNNLIKAIRNKGYLLSVPVRLS
jgi:two-component system, OmpR family, response regulator